MNARLRMFQSFTAGSLDLSIFLFSINLIAFYHDWLRYSLMGLCGQLIVFLPECGDAVNKIPQCSFAVISNRQCAMFVFISPTVFGEMKLFVVLWFLVSPFSDQRN